MRAHPQEERNSLSNDTKSLVKMIRGQIGRRPIDTSQLVITVSGTNVYLNGVVRPLRAAGEVDMQSEMNAISTILRTKPGIKDVVWDVILRT